MPRLAKDAEVARLRTALEKALAVVEHLMERCDLGGAVLDIGLINDNLVYAQSVLNTHKERQDAETD